MKTVKARIFQKLVIKKEQLIISFIDSVRIDGAKPKMKVTKKEEPAEEEPETTTEPVTDNNEYSVKANYKPHKDYANAVKKLPKFIALIFDLPELETDLSIVSMEIKGSIEQRTARVVLKATREIASTGKMGKVETNDVSLFDTDKFKECEKLLDAVNKVISETLLYLEGKHMGELQLALFEKR